jgi:hypothetical protein
MKLVHVAMPLAVALACCGGVVIESSGDSGGGGHGGSSGGGAGGSSTAGDGGNHDGSQDEVGLLPVTGISVPTPTLLVGSNLSCGTGPQDVYQYAVIVDDEEQGSTPSVNQCSVDIIAGGVFDCFTPAAFVNLPVTNYAVRVYFFTYDAYTKNAPAIEGAVTPGSKVSGEAICDLPYAWASVCTVSVESNRLLDTACGSLVSGPM